MAWSRPSRLNRTSTKKRPSQRVARSGRGSDPRSGVPGRLVAPGGALGLRGVGDSCVDASEPRPRGVADRCCHARSASWPGAKTPWTFPGRSASNHLVPEGGDGRVVLVTIPTALPEHRVGEHVNHHVAAGQAQLGQDPLQSVHRAPTSAPPRDHVMLGGILPNHKQPRRSVQPSPVEHGPPLHSDVLAREHRPIRHVLHEGAEMVLRRTRDRRPQAYVSSPSLTKRQEGAGCTATRSTARRPLYRGRRFFGPHRAVDSDAWLRLLVLITPGLPWCLRLLAPTLLRSRVRRRP
jgi:hypothetical protein